MDPNNNADTKIATDFAALTSRYLRFIDTYGELELKAFLERLGTLLAELYVLASGIPDSPFMEHEMDLGRTQSALLLVEKDFGDRDRISRELGEYLGEFDLYKVCLDPYQPQEAITASLSDGLTDIYLDLEEGLRRFSAGDIDEALFVWGSGFKTHWGIHLTEALHAVHWAIYQY